MTYLAIIPARGGSKSIPRKNLALVAGKPLIAWSIQVALESQRLSRVIVSTDDEEIAEVAQEWGAEVPFRRPPELARDDTPGIDPIIHAVTWLEQHENDTPDYVVVLQPTSPLRTTQDIDAAVQLAQEKQVDSVVSVCPIHHHPYWTKRITDDGRLVPFLELEQDYYRRQTLPPVYALNGAIYLVQRTILLKQQSFYTEQTFAYVMPPERSIDVDTSWDLHLVNLVLEDRNACESHPHRHPPRRPRPSLLHHCRGRGQP
ncbi:MAG: acylneuraminate cytidylyltransferase family protein [Chloroflexaceae bacterium]|nr:acylneuraminate cytidylyltransferase family protein [Chloroflexaceae bacterium]